ncbi:MAG TPA: hypothetical protein VLV76_17985 [Candidatus Acidoferrum sp.]|nr:hypothetical protein [Candidatus Acidoferrum sp.]
METGAILRQDGDGFVLESELVLYPGPRLRVVARILERTIEARTTAAMEQAAEDEEYGIDHAPGDVASDSAHDQLGRIELFFCKEEARADGEAEHHDEAEQHLAQGVSRVEIAMDQRLVGQYRSRRR